MKKISKILMFGAAYGGALLLWCAGAGAQNFASWAPPSTGAAQTQTKGQPSAKPSSKTTGVTTFKESDLKGASTKDILKMVQPQRTYGANGLVDTSTTYTLGPTDVIEITVMRHPEVSGDFPINNEGNIQYNFVGDLKIEGMNKDEATKAITKALSEYIISPEVSVKIIGYNSKVVYVVGEVFRPGKIPMRGDTITVREALMQAGLPRLSGVTKRSRLIRPSKNGRPITKNVNVYALLYQGDLRYNDIMKPGDVLYVPPTFLTKVMRSIAPVTAPIGQAAGARVGVDTLGASGTNRSGY